MTWFLWPSRVWFIDRRLLPVVFAGLADLFFDGVSSFRTLRRPFSPPQAIQPCSPFQERHLRRTLFGMAIFLLKYANNVFILACLFSPSAWCV